MLHLAAGINSTHLNLIHSTLQSFATGVQLSSLRQSHVLSLVTKGTLKGKYKQNIQYADARRCSSAENLFQRHVDWSVRSRKSVVCVGEGRSAVSQRALRSK